tara:strand:- start:23 stop:541 length:519 start_codon:yes stop_codon:yes gene_type:complete
MKTESKKEITPGLDVDAQGQVHTEDSNGEIGQSASAGVGSTQDSQHIDSKEHVGVYEETQAGAHASLNHGVSVGGGAIAGDGVTAGASSAVKFGKTKVAISSDVSVGDQIGATGSCHATMKDGILSVGVKGKAAALIGLKGDIDINIDTKAVDNDGKSLVDHCNDAIKSIFG